MISKSIVAGVETITHDEGAWRIQRVGQWSPWVATHVPTGTVVDTGETQIDAARAVVRVRDAELCGETPPAGPAARYTVESRFNRRFAGRRGEPR